MLLETAAAINLNHTSLFVAEKLCNALPDTFWDDENIWQRKILCMFSDSGFLEKYIIKKLMDNQYMQKKFPDYGMRAYWILHNMIFSIAKTNAASYWLRKIVYYSADTRVSGKNMDDYPAIFHGKLFTQGADKNKLESYQKYGNIKSPLLSDCGRDNIFDYPMLDWLKDGKDITEYVARVFWDVFCDKEYEKLDDKEKEAIMAEIKNKLNGYFDVIIGNPPYNTNDEETGQVSETIYNYFCMAADKLNPKYESFIIPSKWIYGKARIPNEFSQNILTSKHLSYLELMDGKTAFPSVDTGEILIYSMDNTQDMKDLEFVDYGNSSRKTLNQITYQNGKNYWFKPVDSIVDKVHAKGLKSLADDTSLSALKSGIIFDIHGRDLLSTGNRFGTGFKFDNNKLIIKPDGTEGRRPNLEYSLIKTEKYSLKFYMPKVKLWKTNSRNEHEFPNDEKDKMISHIYIDPNIITDWKNNKFDHDVVCTTTIHDYHSRLLDYPYNAFICKKGEAPTGYIIGRSLKTNLEVYNLQKYLKTKFVTYLITMNSVSQQFTPSSLIYVPYMDFTQEWDDDKLNKYFGLSDEEIKRIDDLFTEFRPMRKAQLQELENEEEEDGDEDE